MNEPRRQGAVQLWGLEVVNLLGAIARHRGAFASGATLTAAAVAISTLAVVYPGVPTADVQLDDGGVWVTKSNDLLVGHLNYPSRLLDGAARARAGTFDVLQDGGTVLVHDETNTTLAMVDPATVELANPVSIPAGSDVALGGERSASPPVVLSTSSTPTPSPAPRSPKSPRSPTSPPTATSPSRATALRCSRLRRARARSHR
ncbi:hypothetical protein IT882_02230 [Microbacterium schleiferi]|uniref:Uncharacterized protein n=1 Tax=Microbacterium schleiferi TaxID=69362 RepID=A0A7S8RH09_9MICO|nr:hypothetical protein [Microbacterium schleiferi]QPE04961.1 hypothetical protein IT882_02230 [Microbacterium schleiferi]